MLKSTKILICDDSILARKSLTNILTSLGCTEVYEVANGQDAVDKCKEIKPDIAFLDIIMPVKDGITATKEIKEESPDTKIIICSSVGTQTHLREAIKAGAKDFIQKPVTPETVNQILSHILNQ